MNAHAPGISATAFAAEPAAQVNPAGTGQQSLLSVAALAAGGHAVAWLSQDGGNAGVQLRRFDAQGQPAGPDVAVGVDTLDGRPAVAALADGGMAVATVTTGPASVDEPWVTRSAIRVQRFGPGGQATQDVDVGVVMQNRIGAATMRYVADPAVVAWEDGSFLVGWALVEEDAAGRRPQFWVQRFDASGQPVGAAARAANGDPESGFQLTASPAGGWVLTTSHRTMGRTFVRHHPFEGAGAPALPAAGTGHAEGTVLLALRGGTTVLLSPNKVYGTVQVYGRDGQPSGAMTPLPSTPVGGAALPDGGFVVIHGHGPGLLAQRFAADGQMIGSATPVDALPGVQGAALADGSVLLAWTAAGNGGSDVMAQRLR